MRDCWISTHWPSVEPDDSPTRHVYFKTGTRSKLPRVGDTVLIYESQFAVVNSKKVAQAFRCCNGKREEEKVPLGRSAIISQVTVAELPRLIREGDIVRDYGDVGEWSIIPCRNQIKVRELAKDELMELLGQPRQSPPRFLTLWKIPDAETVRTLMERIVEDPPA